MSDATTTTAALRRTPLYDRLKALPSKWVAFAGWDMPVQFAGILEEHRAVRSAAGLFDLTHMGELDVEGPIEDVVAFVHHMVSNDVAALPPWAAMYTVVCRPDGGILDDIIVYRFPERIMLVVNASNKDKMVAWFSQHAPPSVRLTDHTDDITLVALQGPRAEAILQPHTDVDVTTLRYYHFAEGHVNGVACIVSRTGYTGEDGFELYVPNAHAVAVWDCLMAAGSPHGLVPVGLGARDTLRLEARYALYGNELEETVNPYEAGLGWVVKPTQGDFIGRDAVVDAKERGLRRTLVGLEMEDRGVPRHGYEIAHQGRVVGVVTSGSFSPTLERAIALAYVEKSEANLHKIGTPLDVIIRGNPCRARVVKTPFYRGSVKS